MPYTNTIFINLPVASLSRSLTFYTSLGLVQNKTFCDATSSMVSLPLTPTSSPHESPIKLMLLEHSAYSTFIPKDRTIADTNATSGCIVCFSRESREEVDEMVRKAGENGGSVGIREKSEVEKKMEEGGMYGAAFADPDGHLIECIYMPPEMYEGKE